MTLADSDISDLLGLSAHRTRVLILMRRWSTIGLGSVPTDVEIKLAEIERVLADVTHHLHVAELEVKLHLPLASARLRASRALIRAVLDELRMTIHGGKAGRKKP